MFRVSGVLTAIALLAGLAGCGGSAGSTPPPPAGTPSGSVSPTSLSFAATAVGTTAPAQSVTLTNSGNAALTVSSVAIGGGNAGDFAETNTCGSSIAASATCAVSVTFKPSAIGSRAGTLTLADNDLSNGTLNIALSGTGSGATAVTSPAALAFGLDNVGTALALPLTLTNNGNAALAITSLTIAGTNANEFAQTNTCGSSLTAGSTCTVTVTFTPANVGARSASLNLSDNAVGNPSQAIALTGTGTSAVASVTPPAGPVTGGTVVWIAGGGFQSGATVSFGATPATNVTVNSQGTLIQATAPAEAAGSVTVGVVNPDNTAASLASGFTYSSAQPGCGTDCGDVGDPYEGKAPPANQQPISACNTNINGGGNYILTQNIGSDPTALCLQVYYPSGVVNINMGGHTITGGVAIQGGGAPYVLFNGTITCDISGGQCLDWYVTGGRIHHITIENTSATPLANINITGIVASTDTVPVLELDHITSTVLAAPNQNRTRNIMDDGANGSDPTLASVPIEANNNFITCSDGASACQAVEMYDAPHSYIHNNQIVLPVTCLNCADSARGILFDQTSDFGVASFNDIVANAANRGVRVRDSHHMAVDDNLFENVISDGRYAAVHVGETNAGIDDDFVHVFNNTFQLGAGGNAVTSTAAADVYVYDNTTTCVANNCAGIGNLGRTDVEDSIAGDQSGGNITVSNNAVSAWTGVGLPAVHACGPSPAAFDCSGSLIATTTATVCNSGTADGRGTIILDTPPCPPPAAPAPLPQHVQRARRPPSAPPPSAGPRPTTAQLSRPLQPGRPLLRH